MDKYEYIFMRFTISSVNDRQSKDLHEALNKAGDEGWLMVGKLERRSQYIGVREGYETWGVTMARRVNAN